MKNQLLQAPVHTNASSAAHSTSLYELVSKLQLSLLPQATSKKSFIINDVDESLAFTAEENTLSYVIGSLLSNAVYSSSDCCIRIETSFSGEQLQIRIRNNSVMAYCSYMHIPGNFVDAAKKLGGNIGLEKEGNSAITVVFSLSKAAA